MKIAVIYGGRSAEREVSLNSGGQIIEALKNMGYDVSGFDLLPSVFNDISAFDPDLVFLGLHGRFGEDGTIQGALEILGYPYVGSGVLASALAMDKAQTKRVLSSMNLPVPAHRLATAGVLPTIEDFAEEAVQSLGLPLIVKPNREGSTIGLTLAYTHEEVVEGIFEALKYDPSVLVEEYVKGMEVTVVLFGDTPDPIVLGVIEIIPKAALYDYDSKYQAGGSEHVLPARLPEPIYQQVEEYAKEAYRLLGCQDYARVDMMIGEKGPYILEVNTLPGMTSTSLVPDAARHYGYSFPEFLDLLIQRAFARSKQENTQI